MRARPCGRCGIFLSHGKNAKRKNKNMVYSCPLLMIDEIGLYIILYSCLSCLFFFTLVTWKAFCWVLSCQTCSIFHRCHTVFLFPHATFVLFVMVMKHKNDTFTTLIITVYGSHRFCLLSCPCLIFQNVHTLYTIVFFRAVHV